MEHEAHDEEDDHGEAEAAHDHEDHEDHEDAHLKAVFKGLVVLSGIYMFFLVERLMKMYSNSKSNAKRRVRLCKLIPFYQTNPSWSAFARARIKLFLHAFCSNSNITMLHRK